MKKQHEQDLRGGQAMAVELPLGARIRIVDTAGGQIGALMAFAESDLGRGISANKSAKLAMYDRPADMDGPEGLVEGEVVLTVKSEEMLRVTADTMSVKGIWNLHTLACNPAAHRAIGDDRPVGCFAALLEALGPWDVEDPPERRANALDALDLFGKAQSVSLDGLDLPDGFTDDGNWEDLGVPMGRAGDYVEFEVLWPCLVACCNCTSSGDSMMKVELYG